MKGGKKINGALIRSKKKWGHWTLVETPPPPLVDSNHQNVLFNYLKLPLWWIVIFRISDALKAKIFLQLTSTLLFIMNLKSISAVTEKGSKFVLIFFFPFIHIKISDLILVLDKLWR